MASTIAAITTGVGGIVQTADASGNLSLLSGTTTVVAVTPAGAAVTGTLGASGAFSGTSGTFSTTLGVTGVATLGNGAILGVPASGLLTNVTGLPIDAGTVGVLPVLRGGSGVTTSTGTGNVVLSTSATLVAPALGTPASGNLANCTGYPAVASPAGSVLQCVSTVSSTTQSIVGAAVTVSGLSVSITPRATSSKVLVTFSISYAGTANEAWNIGTFQIFRGTTAIITSGLSAFDESKLYGSACYTFLDSPATTSATAYTVKVGSTHNGIRINTSNENGGNSTITVMEIAG